MSAPGVLTSLTYAELGQWLAEIRKVAALPEADALMATDLFVWSLLEWNSQRPVRAFATGNGTRAAPDAMEADDTAWEARQVEDDLARLRETMTRLRAAMALPGALPAWEPESLRRRADAVGHLVGRAARDMAATEIAAAKAEALALADELEIRIHVGQITDAGAVPILNASSVARIIGQVDRAVAFLREREAVTPAVEASARAAKTRAVKYRSDRKRDEAEVAAAGGNLRKAERLRAEAGVLYRQDMAKAGLDS